MESWRASVEATEEGFTLEGVEPELPAELLGVTALDLPEAARRWVEASVPEGYRPEPGGRYFDKLSLRAGFAPDDEYALLEGVGTFCHGHEDTNAILRLTWGNRAWLADGDYIRAAPRFHNSVTVLRDGAGVPGPARRRRGHPAAGAPHRGARRRRTWGSCRARPPGTTASTGGAPWSGARGATSPWWTSCSAGSRATTAAAACGASWETWTAGRGACGCARGTRSCSCCAPTSPPPRSSRTPAAPGEAIPITAGPSTWCTGRSTAAYRKGNRSSSCICSPRTASIEAESLASGGLRIRDGGEETAVSLEDGRPMVETRYRPLHSGLRPGRLASPAPAAPVRREFRAAPPLWEHRLGGGANAPVAATVSGETAHLLAGGDSGDVVKLDAGSGDEVWRVRLESPASALLWADIDGDGAPEALVGSAASELIVLDGGSGRERWRRPLKNLYGSVSPVTALTVADLEGEGEPSLLAGTAGWFVNVFTPGGAPKWARWIRYHVITALEATDADGDGRAEVIVGTTYSTPLTVHDYDGAFRWSTLEQVGSEGNATTPRRGIHLTRMRLADLERRRDPRDRLRHRGRLALRRRAARRGGALAGQHRRRGGGAGGAARRRGGGQQLRRPLQLRSRRNPAAPLPSLRVDPRVGEARGGLSSSPPRAADS